MGKRRKKTPRNRAMNSATDNEFGDQQPVDGPVPATSSTEEVGDESCQTCCSHCQTVFEVSSNLLASADTRVRCGECLSIFDALTNLVGRNDDDDSLMDADGNVVSQRAIQTSARHQSAKVPLPHANDYQGVSQLTDAGAASLAGKANDLESLDVTLADTDLFSANADLPDIAYFDQTRDTSDFNFDDVEEGTEETIDDALFDSDATLDARSTLGEPSAKQGLHELEFNNDVDYISDDTPHEPLVFKYREREIRSSDGSAASLNSTPFDPPPDPRVYSGVDHQLSVSPPHKPSWFLRGMLFLLVILLAGGLYAYRERNVLQSNQWVRPLLVSACEVLSCSLPVPIKLDALKAVNRTVVSHPTLANALFIKFGIINEADFSQQYPVVEIRLTDRAGRLVVTNQFSPSEYLSSWQEHDLLDVGKQRDVVLTVEDPGNTAMSFQLFFH